MHCVFSSDGFGKKRLLKETFNIAKISIRLCPRISRIRKIFLGI